MSTTDHTSDPMADRWEALTQAIRAERDAHRKLRAEITDGLSVADYLEGIRGSLGCWLVRAIGGEQS